MSDKSDKIGFTTYENIGVTVINPMGIRIPVRCPVCGSEVKNLLEHANEMGDDAHRVMAVMEI